MDTFNRLTGEVTTEGGRFATQWDRPVRDESEHPSSKTQTEMAYVPPQLQIMEMMDAGARLQAMRRARFDTSELQVGDDLGDDMPLDPTRNPGADIVDVKRAADAATARLAALAAKQKEARDAAVGGSGGGAPGAPGAAQGDAGGNPVAPAGKGGVE